MNIEALERAIVVCGSKAALAKAINRSRGAVTGWAKGRWWLSVETARAIEKATKGKVTAEELILGAIPKKSTTKPLSK